MWSTSIPHFSWGNFQTIYLLAWWTWFPWVLTSILLIARAVDLSLQMKLHGIWQWSLAPPHIYRNSMGSDDRNFENLANLNHSTARTRPRTHWTRPHIADNAWKCTVPSNEAVEISQIPEKHIRRCSVRVQSDVHCCTLDGDNDSLAEFLRWDEFRAECLWCFCGREEKCRLLVNRFVHFLFFFFIFTIPDHFLPPSVIHFAFGNLGEPLEMKLTLVLAVATHSKLWLSLIFDSVRVTCIFECDPKNKTARRNKINSTNYLI